MRKLFFLVMLFIVIGLSGCATLELTHTETPQVNFVHNIFVRLPKPSALHVNVSATQILTAHALKKTYVTQVALEMTPKHIILVALGAWGGQLFSIDYNGKHVKSQRLPIKHSTIGIQQTLLDVILVYAPIPVLKNMLRGKHIVLIATPLSRIFILHKHPIIKIQYKNKNPWIGNVSLKNFSEHYEIYIKTISVNKK